MCLPFMQSIRIIKLLSTSPGSAQVVAIIARHVPSTSRNVSDNSESIRGILGDDYLQATRQYLQGRRRQGKVAASHWHRGVCRCDTVSIPVLSAGVSIERRPAGGRAHEVGDSKGAGRIGLGGDSWKGGGRRSLLPSQISV